MLTVCNKLVCVKKEEDLNKAETIRKKKRF